MEMIKYINAILGKEYIVSYDILPEKIGAFYEFIEKSKTISEIKSANQESSLIPYFDDLFQQHSTESVLNKFA
jgi:hypothetical protein